MWLESTGIIPWHCYEPVSEGCFLGNSPTPPTGLIRPKTALIEIGGQKLARQGLRFGQRQAAFDARTLVARARQPGVSQHH